VDIRRKTLLILVVMLFTLIAVMWISSEVIVKGGFERVEDQSAEKDTNRVLVALADDINTLDAVASDWASREPIRQYFLADASRDMLQMLDDQTFERLAFH
jgi:sensor domain CHASE-containing protein